MKGLLRSLHFCPTQAIATFEEEEAIENLQQENIPWPTQPHPPLNGNGQENKFNALRIFTSDGIKAIKFNFY